MLIILKSSCSINYQKDVNALIHLLFYNYQRCITIIDLYNKIMNMKGNLELLDVCKLPDVQLHSKTSFLKSIVNKQSYQIVNMRENIAKLSYTIKTIGVQGNEVGIISKRVPLKFKQPKEDYPKLHDTNIISSTTFLSHKSFFSNPLVSIHKINEESNVINEA